MRRVPHLEVLGPLLISAVLLAGCAAAHGSAIEVDPNAVTGASMTLNPAVDHVHGAVSAVEAFAPTTDAAYAVTDQSVRVIRAQ